MRTDNSFCVIYLCFSSFQIEALEEERIEDKKRIRKLAQQLGQRLDFILILIMYLLVIFNC